MLIEAISLRGYCRTFRPPRPASLGQRIGNTAFDPAIRITKLTTIASTGRLMKRSVNDFMPLLRHSSFDIRASSFASRVCRVRVQVRLWREFVINRYHLSVG